MVFDPPEIAWPDHERGSTRFGEALNVSGALTSDAGLANIHVALLSEQELGAGHGGSALQTVAQTVMTGGSA